MPKVKEVFLKVKVKEFMRMINKSSPSIKVVVLHFKVKLTIPKVKETFLRVKATDLKVKHILLKVMVAIVLRYLHPRCPLFPLIRLLIRLCIL
jgi:hypothetical protein